MKLLRTGMPISIKYKISITQLNCFNLILFYIKQLIKLIQAVSVPMY